MKNHYSLVIVGAGPAGLSAALNARILNIDALLVGDTYSSAKTSLAPRVFNYLGINDVTGADLGGLFRSHAEKIGVEFLEKKVFAIYPSSRGFTLDVGGEFLTADCVILTTGVGSTAKIKGETEFLGRGVSYCTTCDAPLLKGKRAVVVGYDSDSVRETAYISEICSSVTFIPMKKFSSPLPDGVKVANVLPVAFSDPDGVGRATLLETTDGNHEGDGFFVLKTLTADSLVYGLKTADGFVLTEKDCSTNINGLFAAGDVAGKPFKYQKATGEGQIAAFSAYDYLNAKKADRNPSATKTD